VFQQELTDLVDYGGPSPHPTIAHTVQSLKIELCFALDRNKAHRYRQDSLSSDRPEQGKGQIVTKKRFTRKQLITHTVNMPACSIGMEACPGAHFLARVLRHMGKE
jgi:hypothetical protein